MYAIIQAGGHQLRVTRGGYVDIAGTAGEPGAELTLKDVLLVEKAPFAGGIITSVGLPYFDGIANIRDNRVVVRGIALELLSKSGACKPDAKTLTKHNPTIPNIQDMDMSKLVCKRCQTSVRTEFEAVRLTS